MTTQLIALAGPAHQVFAILDYLTKQCGHLTLKELKAIQETKR